MFSPGTGGYFLQYWLVLTALCAVCAVLTGPLSTRSRVCGHVQLFMYPHACDLSACPACPSPCTLHGRTYVTII